MKNIDQLLISNLILETVWRINKSSNGVSNNEIERMIELFKTGEISHKDFELTVEEN